MTQEFNPSNNSTENLYTALFEALPGSCILLKNNPPHYTVLAATPAYLAQTGYKKDAILGKGVFEMSPANPHDPADTGANDLMNSLEQVRMKKAPHQLPVQRYDIAGDNGSFSERYWSAANKPVLSANGEVQYIIHIAEDITALIKSKQRDYEHQELQQLYKKVVESEAKYSSLFNSMNQGFCIIELIVDEQERPVDYVLVEANPVFEKQTGLKGARGKSMRHLVPDHNEAWFEVFGRVAKTGEALQFVERSEALDRWFEVNVFKIGGNDNHRVALLFSDITESKKAEAILRESETRFKNLADQSPIFVFIIDADPLAPVSYWNKTWLQYTGQTFEEALGRAWDGLIHEDDIPLLMQHYMPAFERREPYFIPAVRVKRHDGVYRWHAFKGNPRFSATGEFDGYIGVGLDVHEQQLAELALRESEEVLERKVEERTMELAKANKELMRSNQNLEEFAYAASHDLKEPIRKIHLFADRLRERLGGQLKEEDRRYFERMQTAAKRMGTLIDDLLMYSHINRGIIATEEVDLNHNVQNVLEDLELIIEDKGAKFVIGPLPVLHGHKRQLQQLFENLINNALKYSQNGEAPQIGIHSTLVNGHEAPLALKGVDANKKYHLIEVRDNGIGFHQDDADRIFNVFTRLHGNAEYKGTGVGLSIARKVVENHNGYIWAESKRNEGAAFKILLPAD